MGWKKNAHNINEIFKKQVLVYTVIYIVDYLFQNYT